MTNSSNLTWAFASCVDIVQSYLIIQVDFNGEGSLNVADLQGKLTELAEEFHVPGVSVGTIQDGNEEYAFHGVTSIENPLEVDDATLFQFGSTGKTYTGTA